MAITCIASPMNNEPCPISGRGGREGAVSPTRGLDAGLTLDILLGRSIVKFHPSESMLGLIDLFCQTERAEMGEMF